MAMAKLITTPGGEELVLLPKDEYERLVEAAEDLADIAAYDEAMRKLAAGEDELIPSEIVDRLLFSDESPVRVWRDHRGLTVKELAEAAGIKGLRVGDPARLEGVLREALAHPGPVVVDAVVKRQELSMPPTIEAKQAAGFGLYALKALMNGRGSELLEVAKTNLFR